MWKPIDTSGPKFVPCEPGSPKPNGRGLRVGYTGADRKHGAIWNRYKRHTTVETAHLKARIERKGLRLTPLRELRPEVMICAICGAEAQGEAAGRAIRPPHGWLVCGGFVACSVACALACGAGLVPVAMGAP